LPNEKC
jgi:hypothetical protein